MQAPSRRPHQSIKASKWENLGISWVTRKLLIGEKWNLIQDSQEWGHNKNPERASSHKSAWTLYWVTTIKNWTSSRTIRTTSMLLRTMKRTNLQEGDTGILKVTHKWYTSRATKVLPKLDLTHHVLSLPFLLDSVFIVFVTQFSLFEIGVWLGNKIHVFIEIGVYYWKVYWSF